jgi:small-conductance mechanosensitive channel
MDYSLSQLSNDLANISLHLLDWVQAPATLVQAAVVLATAAPAILLAPKLRQKLTQWSEYPWLDDLPILRWTFVQTATDARQWLWLLLLVIVVFAARENGWPNGLLEAVAIIAGAAAGTRLLHACFENRAWDNTVTVVVWIIAGLALTNLLVPAIEQLDAVAISIGAIRLSPVAVAKGIFSLAVLLWLAFFVSRLLEQRIGRAEALTPSLRVLLSKLLKVALVAVAFLAAVSALGVDLTAFAVFSGAIGVGIGFGLQKIVSNLISGVILLLDRSIKPGDVITIGTTFGWIETLGARYASVRTRDGIEHLIPNEELITQRVENWSHSDKLVRLRVPVGVAYHSDVRLAMRLCLEAIEETGRAAKHPPPTCPMRGFGDSSVDLEMRFWISDPEGGRANVISDVLLNVWDKFHAHGIDFPYPQRDLHLKSPTTLSVSIRPEESGA